MVPNSGASGAMGDERCFFFPSSPSSPSSFPSSSAPSRYEENWARRLCIPPRKEEALMRLLLLSARREGKVRKPMT